MFNIGDEVSFHGLEEDFDWVNDVERYIDDVTVYKIIKVLNDKIIVVANDSNREIPANIDDYQIYTKESLRQLLMSRNHQYVAICNKIKQLYRKQEFQFKGIYQ
jgi:hypothetical protein